MLKERWEGKEKYRDLVDFDGVRWKHNEVYGG